MYKHYARVTIESDFLLAVSTINNNLVNILEAGDINEKCRILLTSKIDIFVFDIKKQAKEEGCL